MQRDLTRLANTTFDAVIVGGGIYGVTTAWDAAQRGLSVALIDRGDFGGATSFNSAKTVHGGVRSLQRASLLELRRFVQERRALLHIAPHLVHPLPFLIPAYRQLRQNRVLMRLYFALYDALAFDRNRLPDPSKHLPPSRLLSREECLRLHPLIDPTGVTGAVMWHDCQMYNTDRTTLSFVLSAAEAGAAVANYVEARSFLRRDGRVVGVRAHDALAGGEFDIRARLVVNAVGPWARRLLDPILPDAAADLLPCLSKAINVVTRPLVRDCAVGGTVESRFLFVAPWRECSIVGTGHEPHAADADALKITRGDVERFLGDVNRAFPAAGLTIDDVRLVHRGLLPAEPGPNGEARLITETQVRDHRRDGIDGLLSIVGVRYTTARASAQHAVDVACDALGRGRPPCRTAETPLVGGEMPRFDEYLTSESAQRPPGIDAITLRRLILSYGTRYGTVLKLLLSDPAEAAPLGRACPVTRGEVRHAVRHEMAVRLADAILRRTEAGSAGHPGADALQAAAHVLADELGWSEARIKDEIDDVEGIYKIEDG